MSAQHRCGRTRPPSMWAWPPIPAPEPQPRPKMPIYSIVGAALFAAISMSIGFTVAPDHGPLRSVPAAVTSDFSLPATTCEVQR